jgi:hypothetical protein
MMLINIDITNYNVSLGCFNSFEIKTVSLWVKFGQEIKIDHKKTKEGFQGMLKNLRYSSILNE